MMENDDKKIINRVKRECMQFSLKEQFDIKNSYREGGLNGVTIITPNQIASRFNEKIPYEILINEKDKKSEHDHNRDLIQKIIYGRKFETEYNFQDISIKYVNLNHNNKLYQNALIIIPSEITSNQLNALIYLNKQIKSLHKTNGNTIKLFVRIYNIHDINDLSSYPNIESLDNILDKITINNSLNYYEEKVVIGHLNKSVNVGLRRR